MGHYFYPRSLRLSRKEKELQRTASITYKRPPTLGVFLTNYRKLAFHQSNNQTQGISQPCGHCSLCGKHGRHKSSMLLLQGKFRVNKEISVFVKGYRVQIMVCMLLLVVYVMSNMLDKPKTGFPFVGLLTETHEKLLIFRLKEAKQLY